MYERRGRRRKGLMDKLSGMRQKVKWTRAGLMKICPCVRGHTDIPGNVQCKYLVLNSKA